MSHAATTRNFNTIIFALGRSGKIWAGQRAEDILNFMLEMHLKRGTMGKFEVFSDEHQRIGGTDRYPSPMTYLAMAIGF